MLRLGLSMSHACTLPIVDFVNLFTGTYSSTCCLQAKGDEHCAAERRRRDIATYTMEFVANRRSRLSLQERICMIRTVPVVLRLKTCMLQILQRTEWVVR